MLAITTSDIGTGGAIAVVLLVFVIIGFAKGMVRMTFGLVALAAGMLAGLWGFQKGASIAGLLISSPDPWMSAAVGAILGLAIFFVARALFGVLLSPIKVKDGKSKRLALPGGLLGFIMGAGFCWFLLSGIRYVGTLAELQWIRAAVADPTKVEQVAEPLLVKVKRLVDSSRAGQAHEQFDFINDRSRANLAKLNIVVENPVALTKAMTADKQVRDAVLQVKIKEMLEKQSADLKPYIEKGQYSHLLQSNFIKETVSDTDVSVALKSIEIEKALGLIEEKKPVEEEEKKGSGKKG